MARCLIMPFRWPLTTSKPNFPPMKNAPTNTKTIKAFLASIRLKRYFLSTKGLRYQTSIPSGKAPFDQIPKSQEDDQYYEDPLECKNICGRPQGAKNKNKNKNKREPSIFCIIQSQSKRRGRPPSKVTSTTASRLQSNVPSTIMEVDSSENSVENQKSPLEGPEDWQLEAKPHKEGPKSLPPA
ncbi:hypothetical protein O181_001262 [Austropuccinia psidii MF-1]|uniref:Uncharacterized protein n=1 Tax=Austropuccinia psidii MF-1 TaxID=1389203 RepID=A0A9Q3GCV4_9BASI|nr:hypothetical protein [Austropuccinia psidii MF-1]